MSILKRFGKSAERPRADLPAVFDDYELPTFPGVIADAMTKIAQPDIALEEVADVVEVDPGVTGHLLRLVNSPVFAQRRAVSSVQRAVVLLGRNQLESILITFGVAKALPTETAGAFRCDRFWAAAAKRASIASALAGRFDPARTSENFTGALLQDMALPVLSRTAPGYDQVLSDWQSGLIDLSVAELERFGWTHAEVGGEMAEAWGFPELITDAIAKHHLDPLAVELELPLVSVVAPIREVENVDDDLVVVAERISGLLHVSGADAGAIINEALLRASEIQSLFS